MVIWRGVVCGVVVVGGVKESEHEWITYFIFVSLYLFAYICHTNLTSVSK